MLFVYCFSSRKSLTPVKVTSPTASDDDFLILEDDGPVWFSIPNKGAKRSRDKDSSADKGAKDGLPGTALKQPPANQAHDGPEPQTVSQKEKKKGRNKLKGSEKEATVYGNTVDEMLSPEDSSSSVGKEPPKPRKWARKVPSKDEAAEQLQTTGRGARGGRGKPTVEKESRRKNSKKKKTLKDDYEVKKQKSSKVTRKVGQDTVHDAAAMAQVCVGHADAEGMLLNTFYLLLSECCQR